MDIPCEKPVLISKKFFSSGSGYTFFAHTCNHLPGKCIAGDAERERERERESAKERVGFWLKCLHLREGPSCRAQVEETSVLTAGLLEGS